MPSCVVVHSRLTKNLVMEIATPVTLFAVIIREPFALLGISAELAIQVNLAATMGLVLVLIQQPRQKAPLLQNLLLSLYRQLPRLFQFPILQQ